MHRVSIPHAQNATPDTYAAAVAERIASAVRTSGLTTDQVGEIAGTLGCTAASLLPDHLGSSPETAPGASDDDLVVRRPVGLTDDEWAWVRERADAFWDGMLTGLALTGGQR